MIPPSDFLQGLMERGVRFFVGVPDSLLKDFCACLSQELDEEHHVIVANEGNAVAAATGWYLGTEQPGLVYMQNSGIGNAVNPLTSLTDAEVYGIPMILLIGWRGEPGKHDEPQHVKQGRITRTMLDCLEVPHRMMGPDDDHGELVRWVYDTAMRTRSPAAILVRSGAFQSYAHEICSEDDLELSREEAIKLIAESMEPDSVFVSTTGKASRELYEHRRNSGLDPGKDFLTVGSMGHASSIAFGLARAQPQRKVVCLDGDGAALMHMGSMAVNAVCGSGNFIHVVLNNRSHDSVGGQPTICDRLDLSQVAKACGYRSALRVRTHKELSDALARHTDDQGPHFIEVLVRKGCRKDLGRPKTSPQENKEALMKALGAVDD